jgi:phosphatidate phosphatase PAH1
MQFVGRFFSTVSEFYKDINPATLSGTVDVIVIEQPDGSLACSPFHVRFGKLQVLRLQDSRTVDIAVNGIKQPFKMKMGEAGEAYFIREAHTFAPQDDSKRSVDSMISDLPKLLKDTQSNDPSVVKDRFYSSNLEENLENPVEIVQEKLQELNILNIGDEEKNISKF